MRAPKATCTPGPDERARTSSQSDFLIRRLAERQGVSLRELGVRCDRVALSLLDQLQAFCVARVPAGTVVLATVSAPIRLPSRTAEAMEALIASRVLAAAPGRTLAREMHGNQVRFTTRHGVSLDAPRFFGLVHNPSTSPARLFALIDRWLAER